MLNYETLSDALTERIRTEQTAGTFVSLACPEENVIRRIPNPHDQASVWRTAFIRDIDKIMHCPYYNRYADKTQVFSFYRNDDITHRILHVQLVSRIARTIGRALHLNLDLIEAIALGHDIGHAPFGHAGERYLDGILYAHTGRHFSHNIQSVRVLDKIFPYNISLQTLSGIASHDGELELDEYRPVPIDDFALFDSQLKQCTLDLSYVKKMMPSTLEGCVVRISDIIAYLGKDRQDAIRAKLLSSDSFEGSAIGSINAEIINNMIVNIIENSYGKPYIRMDRVHFDALKRAKQDNYTMIYERDDIRTMDGTVRPMMEELYERLLEDLTENNRSSPIFSHHIRYVNRSYYAREVPYEDTEPNQLVADYIASMTDDYFIDLYRHLFPDSPREIRYIGYFD